MPAAVTEGLRAFLGGSVAARALDDALRALESLAAAGGRAVHLWHPLYPPLLAAIYDPPPVLFIAGDFRGEERPCVAVVGTRSPSPYGLAMAEHFGRELAAAGATVVSGLARGIDTRAHAAALEIGGRSIAVLGTGHDRCYPPENGRLAAAIAGAGALLTEHPPGTGPEPSHFPRRNRIISGLSAGVVVVESDVDGGAMITARLALDQGREVFAVPGSALSPRSRGCHALIREGAAALAASAEEVMAELASHGGLTGTGGGPGGGTERAGAVDRAVAEGFEARTQRIGGMIRDPVERSAYLALGPEPVHLDDLAAATGIAVSELLVALLSLEVRRLVRQLPGKHFHRSP